MTDQAKADAQARRFDEMANGYERWWAPVLAPSAQRLLDQLAPVIEAGAIDILDVGVGTGNLARSALARWSLRTAHRPSSPTRSLTAADAPGRFRSPGSRRT